VEIADRYTLEAERKQAGADTVIPPGAPHILVQIDCIAYVD
jgi:hypothetical protein